MLVARAPAHARSRPYDRTLVKVTLIGAGSTVFARRLISDLVSFPELAEGLTVALMDIDAKRLRATERMTASAGIQVEASLDRRAALDGADYVFTMFQVGGYRPATVIDFDVPKRFGLRQTIGDTVGIGGIMRGLRTIAVLLDVCRVPLQRQRHERRADRQPPVLLRRGALRCRL